MACKTMLLFLIVLVWGSFLYSAAQDQPCNCTGGCGNNGTTISGSDGRIVNVAYGKSTSMSSNIIWNSKSTPACAAVNGRTETVWTIEGSINCVHTNTNDLNAWWQVDLSHNYTVTNITIYRREDWQSRMAGGNVYVDDQLCHSFPNLTNIPALYTLPEQNKITCTPPLTGQVVRFQKHGQDTDTDFYFINICEVQVWACKTGLYGDQCNQTCIGHCKDNDTCDNYYGTCPRGCEPGWTSPLCNQPCKPGLYGDQCNQTCSGHCKDTDTCDIYNGSCPRGCEPGWISQHCNQRITDINDDETFVVVGGVTGVLVVAFLAILGACCFRRCRRRSSQRSSTDDTVRPQDHVYQNSRFNNSAEPAPQILAPENLPALFPFEEDHYYSSLRAKDDDGRTYTELTLANRNIN